MDYCPRKGVRLPKAESNLKVVKWCKADSARRKGSSGLGLFIVKELMEKMGGNVREELEEEQLRIILAFH